MNGESNVKWRDKKGLNRGQGIWSGVDRVLDEGALTAAMHRGRRSLLEAAVR